MCDFLSWIETEKDGQKHCLFLTANDIFHTDKGKQLQDWCRNQDDWVGHGAIRHYYGLSSDSGIERECTDFSNPANFPAEIVAAIKVGQFAGLGCSEGLLNQSAYEEYEKIQQPACEKYKEIVQSALIEYRKIQSSAYKKYKKIIQSTWEEYRKIEQPAYEEYKKIRQPALAVYEKIEQSAYAEYEKTERLVCAEYRNIAQSAYAEYNATINQVFWQLFSDKNNRSENWK